MATADIQRSRSDPGTLANNYMFVRGLQSALSSTETNLKAVLGALETVIDERCWCHWITMEGREFQWNAADFRQFIEAPRPAGCQTTVPFVRGLLKGSHLAEAFEDLVRGSPGGANNPEGLGGRTGKTADEIVNRDNVTVDNREPITLSLSQGVPRPRVRDFDREAPTGNSVSYTLRMLERGKKRRNGETIPPRPDLLEKVKSGELSPNAAAVEAGFRLPAITLPAEPKAAVRILVRHFKGEALETLIRDLAHWAGVPLADDE